MLFPNFPDSKKRKPYQRDSLKKYKQLRKNKMIDFIVLLKKRFE